MINAVFSTLPMFACLFWTLCLALNFRQNDRAKQFLTYFMAVSTTLYFCHAVYFNKEYSLFPFTDSIYTFTTLAVFPLYYLYIRLLSIGKKLEAKNFTILIPSVVFAISATLIYFLMTGEERMQYVYNWAFGDRRYAEATPLMKAQLIRYKLTGIVFALQTLPILYLGSKHISRYNKEIHNYYSDTEGKTFLHIKLLLAIFVATSFASFIMNIIGKEFFATSPLLIIIPSLLFGSLLFTLGYFGNKQNYTAADFLFEIQHSDSLSTNFTQEIVENKVSSQTIIRLIEDKELFKQPDIKISDIARLLGTNRTYISEALNKGMGLSFSELINKYRTECAKELILQSIKEGSEINMLVILEQSGFSAESSFYRIFKSFTGHTPKGWIKQHYDHD